MKMIYSRKDTFNLFQHTALGIDLVTWLRVLHRNSYAIHPAYWPKAFLITFMAIINSPVHLLERTVFNRRIKKTKIVQPVFVLGYSRSGTTYLFYVLGADPNFSYASTYQVLTPHVFLTTGRWLRKLFNFAMPATRPQDNVKISVDSPSEEEFAIANMSPISIVNGFTFPKRLKATFDESVLFRKGESDKQEWKRTFHYFSQKVAFMNSGKSLLSKSPLNTGRVQEILELYPDAKFIHIHRNPFDVYLSNKGLLEKILPKMGLNRANPEELKKFILDSYKDTYEKFLENKKLLQPNQLAEISYEEFVENPIAVLEKVYKQIGLSDFEPVRNVLQNEVTSSKNYKKNTHGQLPEEEVADVLEKWGFMFEEYGYEMKL